MRGKRNAIKKTKEIVLLLALLGTLAFIWGNSLESIPNSQAKSLNVMAAVKPVLEPLVGRGNVTDHLIRKLAHFVEFGLLGCEMLLLAVIRKRRGAQPVVNCLFAGLCAAVIDETIQIFSGRGSQVQDVLLDFAGAAAGILCAALLSALVRALRRRRGRGAPGAG